MFMCMCVCMCVCVCVCVTECDQVQQQAATLGVLNLFCDMQASDSPVKPTDPFSETCI